jgi:hypothetical protein
MTLRSGTIFFKILLLIGVSSLVIMQLVAAAGTQGNSKNYSWQSGDTNCDKTMSFCWYDADVVSDPEVTAYGNRWISQDKDEKPLEWVTQVRCVQQLHVCILARNQKMSDGSRTNTDLYRIEEWNDYQIRTAGVGDSVRGNECEIDSLLLNRSEGSVSMLSVPGPKAATKGCTGIMKPKTVIYKLEIGLPSLK